MNDPFQPPDPPSAEEIAELENVAPETNRDIALRGEAVLLTNGRLREMQQQAIRLEGVGEGFYHWHWAAAINELIARRAVSADASRKSEGA